jgi:phosphopantothenoylcysteine decarboxylase/phosphopantothenate--cysteine ligase
MSVRHCQGRKIVVAVTGGISCYKTCTLVSRLVQAGAVVRVMMTESATKFVQPLTFETLSAAPVVTSVWQQVEHKDSQHVNLARWCEAFVVAPATADFIGKLAGGLCDDIVSLTAAALPREPRMTPVLLAPAMNAQMWANPVIQRNIRTVQELLGYQLVGPAEGWQACRTEGAGRMSEPDEILTAVDRLFASPA